MQANQERLVVGQVSISGRGVKGSRHGAIHIGLSTGRRIAVNGNGNMAPLAVSKISTQ
jgi:hypothetical protein